MSSSGEGGAADAGFGTTKASKVAASAAAKIDRVGVAERCVGIEVCCERMFIPDS